MTTLSETERGAFAANVRKSYLYAFLTDLPLTAPIWVLYLRDERGFSLAQITLLEVPLFLLIVFAEVPTGALADRFGRKVSLTLGSAMLALAVFVYGIATSYLVVLISNLVWGLAFTFRSGADSALLYDSLKEAGREGDFQRINGRFWALRSTAMLSAACCSARRSPLRPATPFAITLGAAIAACCAVPRGAADARAAARSGTRRASPTARTLASGLRDAWRRPPLRYIFLYSGLVTAGAVAPAAPAPAAVAGGARHRHRRPRHLAGGGPRSGNPVCARRRMDPVTAK